MIRAAFASLLCAAFLPNLAAAEVELSFYGGAQSSPHSIVTVTGDSVIPDAEFRMGWEGRSFTAPPYFGFRATNWRSDTFGYGLDYAHNKIYPVASDLPAGYDRLEFTDGLNILTLNAYRRWPDKFNGFTPYIGGGVGIAFPHVEVFYGSSKTFGYQITGPAVEWLAGATYPINDKWSVFGEYKGTYSVNTADLDGGGTLDNDVVTNAVNVGISFSF